MRAHSKLDRRPQPVPSPFKLQALIYVLSARLTELADSIDEVRTTLGLDAIPPAIGADWWTAKQVAGKTGYSQSQIRKLIRQKRLTSVKLGGHVLIGAASVAALMGTKESRARTARPAA